MIIDIGGMIRGGDHICSATCSEERSSNLVKSI